MMESPVTRPAAVVAVDIPAETTDDEIERLADEFIAGMRRRAEQRDDEMTDDERGELADHPIPN
jgi:hypothetical protein